MTNKARNNVRQAATKAQARSASPSAAEIEAYLKAKAEEEAKAKANTATETKPDEVDASKMLHKLVKVVKGRNHVGDVLKVYHITKGRPASGSYKGRKPSLLCEGKEKLDIGVTPVFMNPANVEIIGDMDKADIKRLSDMHKQTEEETLYIAARAVSESDKSVCLSYKAWAKNLYFAKPSMISVTGAETSDGVKIFEIAAWKVRKECGMDAYDALKARQAELEKLVNAK